MRVLEEAGHTSFKLDRWRDVHKGVDLSSANGNLQDVGGDGRRVVQGKAYAVSEK
jgi:hypothetical protein